VLVHFKRGGSYSIKKKARIAGGRGGGLDEVEVEPERFSTRNTKLLEMKKGVAVSKNRETMGGGEFLILFPKIVKEGYLASRRSLFRVAVGRGGEKKPRRSLLGGRRCLCEG